MTVARIKEHLYRYIDMAEDKKLNALYTLLEDEIDYDGYLTKEQRAELDRRYNELESGFAKTYTWEETVSFIDQKLNARNP